MTEMRQVGLISGDLMWRSRIEGPVSAAGGLLVVSSSEFLPTGVDLVLVDLNEAVGRRVEAVARLRDERPDAVVVGFCRHEDRETRRQAMAAGADQVITNASVLPACTRLLAREPLDTAIGEEMLVDTAETSEDG
jgi:DNA-binding NarL/FixJ family response regulator